MASTAHKTEEEIQEHYDSPEEFEKKVKILANWVQGSKHFVAFTGAGVSTSAGIPDFRGPEGVWTLAASGKQRTSSTTSSLKAIPTKTHMSLVKLMREKYLKFLISQNTDGLHRKSGIPPELIAELHGNTNKETCIKCKREYLRDFRVRNAQKVHDHQTGRKCPVCQGELHDSIINFGENLPERELEEGFRQSEIADLCLCLGSSLRVTPAADMPARIAKRKQKLVICNLQKTPLDKAASLQIHAKTDDLMVALMKELGMEIPTFILHRRVAVTSSIKKSPSISTLNVKIAGVDVDGVPSSFIDKVDVDVDGHQYAVASEPFKLQLNKIPTKSIKITLHFMGHYKEPTFSFTHDVTVDANEKIYQLNYNPLTFDWQIVNNNNINGNNEPISVD